MERDGIERGNTKHGPALDDQMEREVEGYLQGQPANARVEEWADMEAAGEDQPPAQPFAAPESDLRGGAPAGISREAAEERSRLGTYLRRSAMPAGRQELRDAAADAHAPQDVLDALDRLPDGEYRTVSEIWAALGGGAEQERW